jgi:hypothetical protein
MKFCPVVPEICRGQVHGSRKERRKRIIIIIIIITRYDYNLTIMKSPLPVALFKMAAAIAYKFNIVRFQRTELIPDIEKFLPVSIFKMATTIPQKISDNVEFLPPIFYAVFWQPF